MIIVINSLCVSNFKKKKGLAYTRKNNTLSGTPYSASMLAAVLSESPAKMELFYTEV